eukprot:Skav202447  [mRNA]  locus=scaffold149:24626:36656:+ [translate_table: standard]
MQESNFSIRGNGGTSGSKLCSSLSQDRFEALLERQEQQLDVWFMHTTDCKRDRPDLFKQQDPGVRVSYEGVEDAVDALLQRVTQSPVDAVVGLFEGCIVVHLAAARLLQQDAQLPWPVSVFFGDLPIRDDRWAAPFTKGAKEFTFIEGTEDWDWSGAPECWYHKIPEKVAKLKELIIDEGPFDVLVAFSQAAGSCWVR